MGELIPLFSRDTEEMKASMIQELADLDMRIEPMERRAEYLRRRLGVLGVERGVGDDGDTGA